MNPGLESPLGPASATLVDGKLELDLGDSGSWPLCAVILAGESEPGS